MRIKSRVEGSVKMLFEDKSTKCPNCQSPPTLLSHSVRFEKPSEIHEFDFRCDKCNRKYEFNNEAVKDLTTNPAWAEKMEIWQDERLDSDSPVSEMDVDAAISFMKEITRLKGRREELRKESERLRKATVHETPVA